MNLKLLRQLISYKFLAISREDWLQKKNIDARINQIIRNAPNVKLNNNYNPGIFNKDGTEQTPPKRDMEFEGFLTEFYKIRGFRCLV